MLLNINGCRCGGRDLVARNCVTRIIIILIEKHKIYKKFKSIEHNTFKDDINGRNSKFKFHQKIENSIKIVEEKETINFSEDL